VGGIYYTLKDFSQDGYERTKSRSKLVASRRLEPYFSARNGFIYPSDTIRLRFNRSAHAMLFTGILKMYLSP
jgi:hypothetical protein